MSLVTYARNAEDILLWRAFHDVKKGFFIDVGANAPIVDSVTYLFYECGWRGINIEPISQWFDLLVKTRGDDINLNAAITNTGEALILYDIPDKRLATTDPMIAERHRQEGDTVLACTVPAATLSAVCQQYAPDTIHFLKIDVKSLETAVISSLDLERYRPQIILVEAPLPNFTEVLYTEWEALITGKRYDFVYFDGLNRFYVAQEVGHLREVFSTPPNVLDNFIPYREVILRNTIAHLQDRVAQDAERVAQDAERVAQDAERVAQDAEYAQQQVLLYQSLQQQHEQMQRQHATMMQEKSAIQQELLNVYAGTAWRISKPLRVLADNGKLLLSKAREKGGVWIKLIPESNLRRVPRQLMGLIVHLLKKLVRKAKYIADTNPRFADYLKKLIQRFPGVHKRLARILLRSDQISDKHMLSSSQIGSAANAIYTKLKSNT